MRMEWATQEEINTAQDDAYLLNQEHIENRP